jgi:Ti-type conjugative transfer relaxase TraA
LARGDRRGYVVVTDDGQIIAVARAVGIKVQEVRAKLGAEEVLPSVDQARQNLASRASSQFVQAAKKAHADLSDKRKALETKRAAQIKSHREARKHLKFEQAQRRTTERARLRRGGLSGLWDRLLRSGQQCKQRKALDARLALQDRSEWRALRQTQLGERRVLEEKRTELRKEALGLFDDIRLERDAVIANIKGEALPVKDALKKGFDKTARHDPRQTFIAPKQSGPVTDVEIRTNPERVLERLTYFHAAFTERDISRELAQIMPTPGEAIAAKMRVKASSELLRVDGSPPRFTTRGYVQANTHLQSVSRNLLATKANAPSKAHVSTAFSKHNRDLLHKHGVRLSEEQKNAITHMTNASRLSMVVGRAGTGKSTILAAANEAWTRAGIRVHGAALSGKAASGLEDASGIACRTLASLELSWANGNAPIKPGEVLVVDEAGMIGTRQLKRIAGKIDEIGAKLVLVGDPDQLPPIEAGEPFRGLIKRHGASHLTEIHRQSAVWQKQATSDLAEGRVNEAVASYKSQGCVDTQPSTDDAITQLTEDYMRDRAEHPKRSRQILAHRRRDVHALNQSVRETLKYNGDLAGGILLSTDHGPRELARGDRIVFTANDRALGVKNGVLATVRQASETRLNVDLEDGTSMAFNPCQFRSFDHGYAVTIHKSQGITVDKSYVLASRSMDDALSYVAMSRHRDDMRLYVSAEDRPKWARGPSQKQLPKQGPALHLGL